MPLAICATPIGNLEDVTLRVLRTLGEADLVLCEDTRHTQILLRRHGLVARRILSYHRHNEAQRLSEVLSLLRAGQQVALVSDAGLPGINDPGSRLVDAAHEAGMSVTVLPGASAVETALVVTGWEIGQYRFLGWLPRKAEERTALWAELAVWRHPAVGFESPRRLPAMLASLADVDPVRDVAVCRELTKRHEQVVRGRATELAQLFERAPKGEITLVIGPAVGAPPKSAEVAAVSAVSDLVAAGAPRRVASEVVSRLTGVPPNTLYRSSL